jgi:predicted nucleotidyltransferase component of viral defense system
MLQYNAVEPRTLDLLSKLSENPVLKDFRLVGGTSLALQLGHRLSIDLDFFSDKKNNLDEIEFELVTFQKTILREKSSYALYYFINNIKVDILNYPYPFKFKPLEEGSLRLASLEDITSMKLKTIMNRGSKKDFYDIYFILKTLSLDKMIELFVSKYTNIEPMSLYKSLNYFEDADTEADPVLLKEEYITWQHVKQEITAQTKSYFK